MTWQEFAQQDPELAALGQERLDRHGLVMVATLAGFGYFVWRDAHKKKG